MLTLYGKNPQNVSRSNWSPAVNRQPGSRRGDSYSRYRHIIVFPARVIMKLGPLVIGGCQRICVNFGRVFEFSCRLDLTETISLSTKVLRIFCA